LQVKKDANGNPGVSGKNSGDNSPIALKKLLDSGFGSKAREAKEKVEKCKVFQKTQNKFPLSNSNEQNQNGNLWAGNYYEGRAFGINNQGYDSQWYYDPNGQAQVGYHQEQM